MSHTHHNLKLRSLLLHSLLAPLCMLNTYHSITVLTIIIIICQFPMFITTVLPLLGLKISWEINWCHNTNYDHPNLQQCSSHNPPVTLPTLTDEWYLSLCNIQYRYIHITNQCMSQKHRDIRFSAILENTSSTLNWKTVFFVPVSLDVLGSQL
jgi:hypothetical protein